MFQTSDPLFKIYVQFSHGHLLPHQGPGTETGDIASCGALSALQGNLEQKHRPSAKPVTMILVNFT
jgi:hypothetical protein